MPDPGLEDLTGLVDVCIDRPLLSLDRPFTYRIPDDMTGVGVGSLVKVPFNRAKVKGWVLGPSSDRPPRISAITQLLGPIRWFDAQSLELYRWAADRFVSPLAVMIDRGTPARVVSEEPKEVGPTVEPPAAEPGSVLASYEDAQAIFGALASVVVPAPEDEAYLPGDAVAACLAQGRSAIVLVPEADPLPETARALLTRFGDAAVAYLGGSERSRYRTWLDIQAGRYRCVVGTRPAVFAPVPNLGLIWVQRESHPGHRDERSPSIHVRDVALERARQVGGHAVLAGRCVSTEAGALALPTVSPSRRSWVPVEIVPPGPEGRAQRLVTALRSVRSGFLFEPRRGYGVAVVCRACKATAACAACGGHIRQEAGRLACAVCEMDARCATCGRTDFGVRRGGRERVEEWVAGLVGSDRVVEGGPRAGQIAVGSAVDVRDVPPPEEDLVAILDADLLLSRTGLAAKERALATWTEAAGWARPAGRVVVQTRFPNAPAIQSLVAGSPTRFHRAEAADRAEAGFPVGAPVFRVACSGDALAQIADLKPITLLEAGQSTGGHGVCLVAIHPETLPRFSERMRELARDGAVSRVDAEPHL